jgi:hypothetical protein
MIGPHDRAKRYRERAEACLQTVATSQTPGTGQIYLLIAEHCLRLAALEIRITGEQLRVTADIDQLSPDNP